MLANAITERVLNGDTLFIQGKATNSKCVVLVDKVHIETVCSDGREYSLTYTPKEFTDLISAVQTVGLNKLEFQGGI